MFALESLRRPDSYECFTKQTGMNNSILLVDQVVKQYAKHRALDQVSLEVPQGCIFGLLGPNGAGKTTLIRIINLILGPDSGSVTFRGEKLRPEHLAHIGYLPEERGLYKKMKVGEQALYFARLKGLSRHEAHHRLKIWFDKFEIMPWWNRKVEELSKGMQQKVQFITTVLHEPELLIFDEPFSGFDPINVNLLRQEILALRDKGTTVIFSTHNMVSVEEICDRIALINRSKKVLEGELVELRQQFRNHTFQVAFSEPFNKVKLALNDAYELLELTNDRGTWRARIRLRYSELNTNELLTMLMNAGLVVSFSEELPSMNDIFIQAVTPVDSEPKTQTDEQH